MTTGKTQPRSGVLLALIAVSVAGACQRDHGARSDLILTAGAARDTRSDALPVGALGGAGQGSGTLRAGATPPEHGAAVRTFDRVANDESPEPEVATPGLAMEGNIYELRIDDIRPCRDDTAAAKTSSGTGAKPQRLGVRVRVKAKIDKLFVSPRDLTLENEGIIFHAKVTDAHVPSCAPSMPQRQLRRLQSAAGFAIFELPADFKADARGPVLAYQPTRWGGGQASCGSPSPGAVRAVMAPSTVTGRWPEPFEPTAQIDRQTSLNVVRAKAELRFAREA